MNQVIILPIGTDPECVSELRHAGYVPVLTDNPSMVRLMSAEASIPASDVIAALKALSMTGAMSERQMFVSELFKRMTLNESKDSISGKEPA